MEDKQSAARAYLAGDALCYVNMQEVLDRDTADVLWAGADGVLLYENCFGGYMMSAQTPAAADAMLALVPPCRHFVGHEPWYKERVGRKYGLDREEQIYVHAVWTRPQPPALPPVDAELRLLEPCHAEFVHAHYSHTHGLRHCRETIGRGMYGAFVDGAPAGFIGFHEEGAMGLLEVLPAYQRRGLGLALLLAQTRLALERGRRAFAQIITDNAPSAALHRRAGFALSDRPLFWLS